MVNAEPGSVGTCRPGMARGCAVVAKFNVEMETTDCNLAVRLACNAGAAGASISESSAGFFSDCCSLAGAGVRLDCDFATGDTVPFASCRVLAKLLSPGPADLNGRTDLFEVSDTASVWIWVVSTKYVSRWLASTSASACRTPKAKLLFPVSTQR